MTDIDGYDEPMVKLMERIAEDLEKVFVGVVMCAGFLGFIAFMLVLRTLIGR